MAGSSNLGLVPMDCRVYYQKTAFYSIGKVLNEHRHWRPPRRSGGRNGRDP
jgi:hypothetical protein